MPARLTEEEAVTTMQRAGMVPLEPYVGTKHKWRAVCVHCGQEGSPQLGHIRIGQNGCRNCAYLALRGAGNKSYKTGKTTDKSGYVELSGKFGHPNARSKGRIFEHVYLMAEHLGRALTPNENVHHKNGVRDDNRIENLELWTKSQPSGQRVKDKVQWAKEMLRLYEPEALATERGE